MHVGCGVYEGRVKGRRYLYFWHYEFRGARRVQVKEYLGPATSADSFAEAARLTNDYYRAAIRGLERSRKLALVSLRSRRA